MPHIRHKEGHGRYRHTAVGESRAGDEHEVSEAAATYLCGDLGIFERVDESSEGGADDDTDTDADTDAETKDSVVTAPGEFTISEIEDELATGDWDEHLDTLEENEEAGKDRDGVYDVIGVRRAEIADEE